MLSPRPPAKKPRVPVERSWGERLAAGARAVREVARFTWHGLRRRRWYVIALLVYQYLATGFVAWWAALLVLAMVFAVYLDRWLSRRAGARERSGLEPEKFRVALRAWGLERWRAGWAHYRWQRACYGFALVQGGDNQKVKGRHRPYPRPAKIRWDFAGDAKMVCNHGEVQVPGAKIQEAQDALAEAMHCMQVVPRPTATKGIMEIALYWQNPLARHYSLGDVPLAGNRRLISIGFNRAAGPFVIPKHMGMIVTGSTGSGKSNFGQGLIGLLLADADWVELFVVDSKGGMEFPWAEELLGKGWVGSHGHLRVSGYCKSGTEAEAPGGVIEQCRQRLQDLQALARARGVTEFTASSEETPLVYLVVDEAKRIPNAMASKPVKAKVRGRDVSTDGQDLDIIASQGRATQVVPVLFTQDARGNTIPTELRTLLPTRIGFATDNKASTICALGDDAVDAGAKCHELMPYVDAGMFYARCLELETSGKSFEPGKTAEITPEDKALISCGEVPPGLLARHPYDAQRDCILYRVWEHPDGRGLRRFAYIGETWQSFEERAAGHRENRPVNIVWCPEHQRQENWWVVHVDESTVMIEPYPSKRTAQHAEAAAIKAESPYWNRVHNKRNRAAAANVRRGPRVTVPSRPAHELARRDGHHNWGGE
jgi:hypothetical protein